MYQYCVSTGNLSTGGGDDQDPGMKVLLSPTQIFTHKTYVSQQISQMLGLK